MATLTLTFDNGPDPTWTPHVLDVLRAYDVKATLFVIGRKLVLNPELHKVSFIEYDPPMIPFIFGCCTRS